MASNGIQASSLVQLISGGPDMTVAWVDGDTALCEWFDKKGDPQSRTFPVASLKQKESGGGWGTGTASRQS